MTWYEVLAIFVVANLLFFAFQFLLLERRSRELQWEQFNEMVKRVRERLEQSGWVIVHADFRPGWITGRGSVTYRNGTKTFTGAVTVDGRATTRAAGRLLAKGIR